MLHGDYDTNSRLNARSVSASCRSRTTWGLSPLSGIGSHGDDHMGTVPTAHSCALSVANQLCFATKGAQRGTKVFRVGAPPKTPDSLPKAYPLAEGNREATATVVPKTSLRSPLVPAFGGSLRSGHNSLRSTLATASRRLRRCITLCGEN